MKKDLGSSKRTKPTRQELELLREKEKRRKLSEYKESFSLFAEEQIQIITKDATKGFVPFRFNEAQQLINDKIEEQRRSTGKVRAIILKARQQGISTYSSARVYWKTFFQQHTRSVVMAHDSATSDALFQMSKNLIRNMDPLFKPKEITSNAKEIKIQTAVYTDKDAVGSYRLYTAGSPEAGRGTTPTILHASEVAFWQHDEKILAGLFQGISQAEGTEVILESTANGASGKFYDLYQKAANGESDYIAIFIPWYITQEYRTPVPDNFELTIEEQKYKDTHSLDDEQMFWRRLKIVEGGVDKFKQEYPATAEEAFLVSGSSVFDAEKVSRMITKKPEYVREYDPNTGYFEDHREGNLEIWSPPTWNEKFIIGADVALGAGNDYSTAVVLDREGHIRALYRNNKMDPNTFGDLLFYLGRYFNNALLAVESNSIGIAPLIRLQQMEYVNLYYQTRAAALSNEPGERAGFRMTSTSKPMVIGNLKRAVEDDEVYIPSNIIVDEMRTYVQENNKTNALDGHHDDTIMALAIAWEVRRTHIDKLTNTTVPWSQRTSLLQQVDDVWL